MTASTTSLTISLPSLSPSPSSSLPTFSTPPAPFPSPSVTHPSSASPFLCHVSTTSRFFFRFDTCTYAHSTRGRSKIKWRGEAYIHNCNCSACWHAIFVDSSVCTFLTWCIIQVRMLAISSASHSVPDEKGPSAASTPRQECAKRSTTRLTSGLPRCK